MLRLMITPRWLIRHAIVVFVLISFCWLGNWQWDAARSQRGSLQNYGYALEWWVFAAFAVFMWGRTLYDEARPPSAAQSPSPDEYRRDLPSLRDGDATAYEDDDQGADEGEDSDEELAAYNAYLAWLAAHPRT
ncbi:MAG: hypothetical protein M3P91_00145 [Actinomycetota bacterium]|nr:hypothetical protein [Actinomycetota bacterium]